MPRFRLDVPATGLATLPMLHAAVVAWALARAHRGDFILRLDAAPAGDGPALLADLRRLEVDWDEGPDLGGPHAPYVQTGRRHHYEGALQQLRKGGHVRLSDVGVYLKEPAPAVPPPHETLRGALSFPPLAPAALLLQDAAGNPTRLLRTVVDDQEMAITHAVSPAEDLPLLQQAAALSAALAWQPPAWIVLPPLRAPAGGPPGETMASSLAGLLAAGLLPVAVRNYLLLLGWSPAAEEEILDPWTMRSRVQLGRFSPAPVRLDWDLLLRLNHHYLAQLSDAALATAAQPLLEETYGALPADDRWLVALVHLLRPNLNRLSALVPLAEWAFAAEIEYTDAARAALLQEDAGQILVRLIAAIARDAVLLDRETAAHILAKQSAQQRQTHTHPAVPAALLGQLAGPSLSAVCALLGRDRTLQRLAAAVRWRRAHGASAP